MRADGLVCAIPENVPIDAMPPARSRSRRVRGLLNGEFFSCLIVLLAKIIAHSQYDCILAERLILSRGQAENTGLIALRVKSLVFRGGGLRFGIRDRSIGEQHGEAVFDIEPVSLA